MFNTVTINTYFEMLGINPLTFMDEEVEPLSKAIISQGKCKTPAGAEIVDSSEFKKFYAYLDDVADTANALAHKFTPPQVDLTPYGVIPRKFADLFIHLISQRLNDNSRVLVTFKECAEQVQEVLVTYSPTEVSIDQMDLCDFKETVDVIEAG